MSIKEQPAKKLVIVGGVAGGMSAAARARRLSEQAEIVILERSGHVSYANCGLPYYLGREIKSEESLLIAKPKDLYDKLNLDIRVRHEVIAINHEAKTVEVRDLNAGKSYTESYDELLLSVEASPIRPSVPGIDLPGLFCVRNIDDIQAIEHWIKTKSPRTVVIAGGGFIGLEMAEQMSQRGLEVTLVDSKDQVLAPVDREIASMIAVELKKHGVRVLLNSPINAFSKEGDNQFKSESMPKACWVEAGDEKIPADLVILGLGVRPDVKIAKDTGITIGERGGIRVNSRMQTNLPNIWAVGDAIEVFNPINKLWTLIALGGPANRQGRLAANNMFGQTQHYAGTIGTAILRVFDLTIACVGLNESQLRQSKMDYHAIHLHPANHAGYYPGAVRLDIKLLFDKYSGTILGAQVAGSQGVDKRVDVLATALQAGMTVRDLAELELAYAPPFGAAKDPINLAGMLGTNVLEGFVQQIQHDQLNLQDLSVRILDVRSMREFDNGSIPGSIHIPLPELRSRLEEIPRDKTLVVFCQSGQRSYNAVRYLSQNGLDAKNLAGGYLTWSNLQQAKH